MDIRIRSTEGVDAQPHLLWDSVWDQDNVYADWVIEPLTTTDNAGGLQAKHTLHTAILICLFTWRRADESDTLENGADPKGWFGDEVPVETFDQPMGSRLWLLMRQRFFDGIEQVAVDYCYEALQPLLTQGAVARFDITAEADKPRSMLGLVVKGYSKDGVKVYDQRFQKLWAQEHSI